MRNLEGSIQQAVVYWCRHHQNRLLHRVFHIPNGGMRDRIIAMRLKREGVLAGVPDLCLPLPGGRVYWQELKTQKGKPSAVQKALHKDWAGIEHHVEVAYGYNDSIEKFERVVGE